MNLKLSGSHDVPDRDYYNTKIPTDSKINGLEVSYD